MAYKLYPRGIEDRNIWERAGGRLHEVNLNKSGGDQWFDALKLIDNGGGNVTFSLLIQIMKEDFSNNGLLKSL